MEQQGAGSADRANNGDFDVTDFLGGDHLDLGGLARKVAASMGDPVAVETLAAKFHTIFMLSYCQGLNNETERLSRVERSRGGAPAATACV